MPRRLQRRLHKSNRDGQTDVLRGRTKSPAVPGPPKGEGRGRGNGKGDKNGKNPKKKGPRSESRGKGRGEGGDDPGRGICYWFNHGGCWRVECHFAHTTLPKSDADKMTRPAPRSPSPQGGKDPKGKGKMGKGKNGKDPKGKGKGKGKDKNGQKVNWARSFSKVAATTTRASILT